jgi:hypothetical protein
MTLLFNQWQWSQTPNSPFTIQIDEHVQLHKPRKRVFNIVWSQMVHGQITSNSHSLNLQQLGLGEETPLSLWYYTLLMAMMTTSKWHKFPRLKQMGVPKLPSYESHYFENTNPSYELQFKSFQKKCYNLWKTFPRCITCPN